MPDRLSDCVAGSLLGQSAVIAQNPRRAPEKLSRSSAEIGFQSLGREDNTMEHYEEQDYLHCQAETPVTPMKGLGTSRDRSSAEASAKADKRQRSR